MRPHITILSAVTGRLWRSRLPLLEGWADVWTLPACWSVSRVKRRSSTFFSSPVGTARQARGSPPPLATPHLRLCLFFFFLLGSCPENDPRGGTEPQGYAAAYPPSRLTALTAGTDKRTQALQIGASVTGARLTDLMLHLLSVCHQIRGDWIQAGQTDRHSSRRTDIWTENSGHCGVYVAAGLLLGYKTKQG